MVTATVNERPHNFVATCDDLSGAAARTNMFYFAGSSWTPFE